MAGENTIARVPEQFDWVPEVVHGESLREHNSFVICGMGGSQLAPMHIKQYGPEPSMLLHRDYGLPDMSEEMERQALVILSSYSGTTEETLDSGREALATGLSIAAVSTGGKLIEFAREHALPHVVIPETGLQPRLAVGYSMLAIARLMGDAALESRIRVAGQGLKVEARKDEGLRLAESLQGKVPLAYSSRANEPIAYIWKIKLNETSKIPAFFNVFPELCHNELNGLDVVDSTRALSANLHVLMLEDESDEPRDQKRMKVAGEIFEERGIPVSRIALRGAGFAKALDAAVLADWISYALAAYYGVPDEATPLIAEFKKRIAS